MSVNGISYNPYLYTGAKAAANSYKAAATKPVTTSVGDEFKATQTSRTVPTSDLKKELEKTKKEQGFIGGLSDGFKNLTGIGAGSKKAEKAVEKFEKGEISQQEMQKAVNGYKEGQKQCVDMVVDIGSGIAAFGAFALATGAGIAAAPFTGGASLGLVAAGFGIAAAAGAATKAAIKSVDAAVGRRKYDSLGYDLATGGINGMFAPITAGIGGAAGKAVASKVGVTAIREGGEILVQESIKGTAKGAITRTLLTTNIKYTGGTMAARTLALGTDMAVNGAITGAVDSGVRYVAGDEENKSFEGFAKEVGTGTLGGLILAPVIGGGMRAIGNGIGKVTGNLETKVSNAFDLASGDMTNRGIVNSTDPLKIKAITDIASQQERIFTVADEFDKLTTQGRQLDIAFSQERALVNDILGTQPTAKGKSNFMNAVVGTMDETQKIKQGLSFERQVDDFVQQVDGTYKIIKNNLDAFTDSEAVTRQMRDMQSRIDELIRLQNELSISKKINNPEILSELTLDNARLYNQKLNRFEELAFGLQDELAQLSEKNGLSRIREISQERLAKIRQSEVYKAATVEQQKQMEMESTNIFLSKFMQTYAGDESLPIATRQAFEKFQSNCMVSRTLTQAQNLSDELYGSGKYTLVKSFGAGTVGETYLAKTADGKEVVIKMLKDGVSPERFAQDKETILKIILANSSDEAEKKYMTTFVDNMFDVWTKELDFGLEAKASSAMSVGSKRFNVAQSLEVGSKNGQNISLVMEKAEGYPLDKLLKMIKSYNENPAEFASKYADDIVQNPWLANVEDWGKKLPRAYQAAQNEQIMFASKNGAKTIHADPHAGNVFASMGSDGKFQITYIDTGNTLQKTSTELLGDLNMTLKALVGDSKGAVELLLEGATFTSGKPKQEIIASIFAQLDEQVFKARVNLNDAKFVNGKIDAILKANGVVVKSDNANYLKAALQFTQTQGDLTSAANVYMSKINISDVASAIKKSFLIQPIETLKVMKSILSYSKNNSDEALRVLAQMFVKN